MDEEIIIRLARRVLVGMLHTPAGSSLVPRVASVCLHEQTDKAAGHFGRVERVELIQAPVDAVDLHCGGSHRMRVTLLRLGSVSPGCAARHRSMAASAASPLFCQTKTQPLLSVRSNLSSRPDR